MSDYTPMIQQYLEIKAQYEDSFLFFRLGDFYELFFDDALQASQLLEITLTSRMGGTEEKIPMCGVPHHSANQYIRKLIEKGHKVAICEQVEDPKQAKGVVKREVIRVITPGTLVEQHLLVEKENNYIIFISKARDSLALVSCDLSTGEVTGTETEELATIVEEVIQFDAKEVIVDQHLLPAELNQLEQRLRKRASITSLSEDDQLHKSIKKQVEQLTGYDQLPLSLQQALYLMYYYLGQTQKRSIEYLQAFQYYQANHYLHLDQFTQRNLELLETIRDHSRKGSLLWLIDHTSTAMGGRLIKKWLQRPLLNLSLIEERLDAVSILLKHTLEREELVLLLREVYDLERLAARVSYGNVSPKDLQQLHKSLGVIPQLKELLTRISFNQQVIDRTDPCPELFELLGRALAEEPPLSIKEGGIFRTGFNTELDSLVEASKHGKQWIAGLEAQEREKTGIKSLKVGFNRVFGYYIEVTRSNLHLLEGSGYERKQTLANAERFITPELKEKEALILDANERMLEVEYQLFLQLREQVNTYTDRLQKLAQNIAQLDVLCSFAYVSERNHYVRPQFNQEGIVSIKAGRHPVVEQVLEQGFYVANDIELDDHRRQILLITGPNMAGKSTYMRQIALLVLLAQCGCYVPAEAATLPIFDQIFTRIGAADDLVSGQSTFMVEMLETKQALCKATPQSLILLDEIGRGTSTYDGMSLAQAVIEYIHDHVQAKTLFATHYHELTALDTLLAKLTNMHVACSEKEGKVTFLHKVQEGKADRSYGIHVAQLAGLPEAVITRAEEILTRLEEKQQEISLPLPTQTNQNQQENIQLSLFEQVVPAPSTVQLAAKRLANLQLAEKSEAYLEEIAELDLVTMSPIEALNTLFSIQQRIKQGK